MIVVRNRANKKICEICPNGTIVIVYKGNKTLLVPTYKGTYKIINL